jgi:hypothetical protein
MDDRLLEAVARTFHQLGWIAFGDGTGRRFVAEVGVNFWSWGEEVRIEIDGDTIEIESHCRLVTQCFDWGKNQQNVATFLAMLDETLRRIEQERDAGGLAPPDKRDGAWSS